MIVLAHSVHLLLPVVWYKNVYLGSIKDFEFRGRKVMVDVGPVDVHVSRNLACRAFSQVDTMSCISILSLNSESGFEVHVPGILRWFQGPSTYMQLWYRVTDRLKG